MKLRVKLLLCLAITLFATSMQIGAEALSAKARVVMAIDGGKQKITSQSPQYLPMILLIDDEDVVAELTKLGTVIFNRREDLLLACIPVDEFETAMSLQGIRYADTILDVSAVMDMARPACGVDMVHAAANGLPQTYDGSGVIVGFSDIGFDPHHIAFGDRVKALYHYDASYAQSRKAESKGAVRLWQTDNSDQFHATHVANILAGGYRGNDYYGVATGAEIVGATSMLTDVGILAGVEDIIAYAKAVDKPAVINLSLSTSNGPHDGTSLASQYLSRCAQDAVICISAGNSALSNSSVRTRLIADMPEDRYTINDFPTYVGFTVQGFTDAWSSDDKPFEARIEVVNREESEIVWASPWIGSSGGAEQLIVDAETYPEWGEYMQGKVAIATELSPLNNRFNAGIAYNITTEAVSGKGPWAKYSIGLAMRRLDDVDIDICADASRSYLTRISKYSQSAVGGLLSINDWATAPGIISVGATSTRNWVPNAQGGIYSWDFEESGPASFSSYGTDIHGNKYPHISAPGNYVVSAISRFYEREHQWRCMSEYTEVGSQRYGWGGECGTSMSAPIVAGTAALMLQADPTLDSADVLSILTATAKAHDGNPQWGHGELDALAALKQTVEHSGVVSPIARPLVAVENRCIVITGYNASAARAYDINGVAVDIGAPLSTGLYIVVHPEMSVKVIVK